MKQLEVRLPHALDAEEVKRRLDRGLEEARAQYGAQVGPIDSRWTGAERLDIGLSVMGMKIAGAVRLLPGELVIEVGLPMMAALFAGRIRSGIEEQFGRLLVS